MPIIVNYSPVGAIGGVASEAGRQQGTTGALMNALQLAQYGQRERFQNQNTALQIWSQRFNAANQQVARREQNWFNERQQNQEMAFRAQQQQQAQQAQYQQRQFEAQQDRMSRLEMLAEEEGMRNRLANADFLRRREENRIQDEQTQQLYEMRLSEPQRRQKLELQNRMEWVQQQPGWTDEQKQDAINQLQHQWLGIQPMPKESEEFPLGEGRAPGVIYEDRGYLWTTELDANGQIKIKQHSPVRSVAPNDRQLDRKPFRRGAGVYQFDENGKENVIVAPPKLPDLKFYADTYNSVRESMMNDLITEPGKAPPKLDEAAVQRAVEAQIRFIMEQNNRYQELLIQQAIGNPGELDDAEGTKTDLSYGPSSPYFGSPERSGGVHPNTDPLPGDFGAAASAPTDRRSEEDILAFLPGYDARGAANLLESETRAMTDRIKESAKQKMQ